MTKTDPIIVANDLTIAYELHRERKKLVALQDINLEINPSSEFAIDPDTGVITLAEGATLDFETTPSHEIKVRAISSDGAQSTSVFEVNVDAEVILDTPPNEAPVITSYGSYLFVQENIPTDQVIYTVVANDPNEDTLTYAVSGTDALEITRKACNRGRSTSG